MQEKIDMLESEFDQLKRNAIKLLEGSSVEVKDVVYELSTLSATEMNEHKVFLKEESEKLEESKHHMALFRCLNYYWTYLSPHLLKHLVGKLPPLKEMEGNMEVYMTNLREFRERTPLDLFCQIGKEHIEAPKGFQNVVAIFKDVVKFKQSKMTLQDLEDFRLEYGKCYKLREFALMLLYRVKENSFIVTFFAPASIVKLLQSSIPEEILNEYGVTKLIVSGNCVFMANGQTNIQPTQRQKTELPRTPCMVEGTVSHLSPVSPEECIVLNVLGK